MKKFNVSIPIPESKDIQKLGERIASIFPPESDKSIIFDTIEKGGEIVKELKIVDKISNGLGWLANMTMNISDRLSRKRKWLEAMKESGAMTQDEERYESQHKARFCQIPVVGVTFEGRQQIIKDLPADAKIILVSASIPSFPNRIAVIANGKSIGWVPDKSKKSVAKMLRDRMNEGHKFKVASWERLGGTEHHPRVGIRLMLSETLPNK